jgi:hypothetical protein
VLQEDSRSSIWDVKCAKKRKGTEMLCVTCIYCPCLICLILILMIVRCLYLHYSCWLFNCRRLKINHDSHEFILEIGTVAKSSKVDFPVIFLHIQNLSFSHFNIMKHLYK